MKMIEMSAEKISSVKRVTCFISAETVEERHERREERGPAAHPRARGEELEVERDAHPVEDDRVRELRPRRAEDGERLPREERVEDARDARREEHLDDAEVAVGAVGEEHAEGDRGREAREEEEDARRERLTAVLRAQRLDPVVDVPRRAPLDVGAQAAGELAREGEGRELPRFGARVHGALER